VPKKTTQHCCFFSFQRKLRSISTFEKKNTNESNFDSQQNKKQLVNKLSKIFFSKRKKSKQKQEFGQKLRWFFK